MILKDAVVTECDAPDCIVVAVTYDGEQAGGYHGSAYEIHKDGGTAPVSWYACKVQHIRAAILYQIGENG